MLLPMDPEPSKQKERPSLLIKNKTELIHELLEAGTGLVLVASEAEDHKSVKEIQIPLEDLPLICSKFDENELPPHRE